MREQIISYCDRYGIPEEHKNVLAALYDKIESDGELSEKLTMARDILLAGGSDRYSLFSPVLRKIDAATGANSYTTDLLFFITCVDAAKKRYERLGIDLSIWRDSMSDLAVKYRECVAVYGVPGIFTEGWHCRFFHPDRFQLGRMQYETVTWDREEPYKWLKYGDTLINMHIPGSTGQPFDRAARRDSYKRAYDFYRDLFPDGKMAICCGSWLLFEEQRKFLKGCPNILDFMDDFEIIESHRSERRGDLWRIFNTMSQNVDEFPTDTALQRSYADWLRAGNDPGGGFGLIMIEGPEFFER